jgi:hypothetical protein
MLKIKSQLVPLAMIILGLYLRILPPMVPMYQVFANLLEGLASILIIGGIIFYANQSLQKRLEIIEEELSLSKENKVSNVQLLPSENSIAFIEQIKKNRFIYKASIYLPNTNIDTLLFLKNFLSSVKLDSTARIVINVNDSDEIESKNLADINQKHKNQIELKKVISSPNSNYILILDTKIWILADFGEEIKSNLLFSVSGYDEQGKSFIEMYNRIWENAITFKAF